MSLEEWELNVQVESPVDFISLAHHGYELRDIQVRAQAYDRKAAQLEMDEKVLIDSSLQGKTR